MAIKDLQKSPSSFSIISTVQIKHAKCMDGHFLSLFALSLVMSSSASGEIEKRKESQTI